MNIKNKKMQKTYNSFIGKHHWSPPDPNLFKKDQYRFFKVSALSFFQAYCPRCNKLTDASLNSLSEGLSK